MIRDDVLQNLRKGMSLVDVKKEYRGKSQPYEALRLFLEDLENSLNNKRALLGADCRVFLLNTSTATYYRPH